MSTRPRRRRNSVAPAELVAEMDRVYSGALEIIARHTPKSPQGGGETTPPAAPHPTAQRVVPAAGRSSLKGCKITPETRFRKAPGRTRITPGSLRARVLAEKFPATLAELSAALGQDARGPVGKLRAAGWLEIVSSE